ALHRRSRAMGSLRVRRRGRDPARAQPPRRLFGCPGSSHAGAGMIENVLASRYASPEIVEIWDPATKVKLERRLWVTVMEAQKELGVAIPDGAVEDYRGVIDQVDLASISERERILRHDVKARLEEFNSR